MTDIDIPLPSLTGRRAVLTGGSDGMGLVIAEHLAAAGAEIVLPVRNRAKGDRAVRSIHDRVPGARLELRDLDLSSLSSVAALGRDLRADGRPVHLLINNAGVMTPPERQTTADGYELQFGTNHLGHVALVGQLLPLLIAGKARVVTQVSIAAARGRIDWDDLQAERSYDGQRVYSQSKIALGLFALELDRRSRAADWGVTSVLSHPGVAPTSLLAARPEIGRTTDTPHVRAIRWMSRHGILVGTVRSAAQPALLAATTTSPRTDVLYGPRGPLHVGGRAATHALYRPLRDKGESARVWEESERLAGVALSV